MCVEGLGPPPSTAGREIRAGRTEARRTSHPGGPARSSNYVIRLYDSLYTRFGTFPATSGGDRHSAYGAFATNNLVGYEPLLWYQLPSAASNEGNASLDREAIGVRVVPDFHRRTFLRMLTSPIPDLASPSRCGSSEFEVTIYFLITQHGTNLVHEQEFKFPPSSLSFDLFKFGVILCGVEVAIIINGEKLWRLEVEPPARVP
ncbi:hypothetical protein R3P38DRAFT_2764929 [Favolaschia claudopus]|uniref:Uncharacterized protein n=1 Tax=Favolaschia claudopus TaxID=2862362 RepID=A0AAW0DCP9_9AGAR